MKAPMFVVSADSRAIASLLREAKVGDVISYAAISAAIGRDVREEARSALAAARKIVLREDRIVFDAVRGDGLQRLDDGQIVSLGDRARDHIRRTTRKTVVKMVCVDYPAMGREAQVKHNTTLSFLAVIGEMSTNRAMKKLETNVAAAGGELPAVKAAIAAFGGKAEAAA